MATTRIRHEQIRSTGASDGQVLMADGSGNAAWETIIQGVAVQEEDGAPALTPATAIHVPSGTLIDEGGGVAYLGYAAAGHTHAAGALTTHWEPITDGDVASPELIFHDGDVIMAEVA